MNASNDKPIDEELDDDVALPGSESAGGDESDAGSETGLDLPRLNRPRPGTAPGLDLAALRALRESMPEPPQKTYVTVIDYCPERCQFKEDVDIFDVLPTHRPDWSRVRWINIDGISDLAIVEAVAAKWELHPLAIEDVVHVPQRPKVDAYPSTEHMPPRTFIVARMLQLIDERLHCEQISIFLGRNTIITFQESHGDVWDPIRARIRNPASKLRENEGSFLAYALLDAIVDHCFPILEHYGDRLEELEERILDQPDTSTSHAVHEIKRELLLLRRQLWPMRDIVNELHREPLPNLSDNTRTYLRDVYDHTVQIIDIIETYREVAIALNETYMMAMSNRMNQVMKVLTIIATIFIPLTFLAGVYGMNMYIPENHWGGAYPTFWGVCVTIAGGMVWWFRRRGWL